MRPRVALLAALAAAAPAGFAAEGTAAAMASVVTVHVRAAAAARDVAGLGAERRGSGVVLDPGDLVLTSGTLVQEAVAVLVTTLDGRTVASTVAARDDGAGTAVLRPAAPLAVPGLRPGELRATEGRDPLNVLSAARGRAALVTFVMGRGDYAPPWEQLIDNALLTAPATHDPAGAALVDAAGRLLGVGAPGRVEVRPRQPGEKPVSGNVFIPVDAFGPLLGRAAAREPAEAPARPWLGVVIESARAPLVLSRVLPGSPAERAGLRPGDEILRVDGAPAGTRVELYRRVQRVATPGTELVLAIRRDAAEREVRVRVMDAQDLLIQRAGL